jgi:hypothetical protein
MTKVHANGLFIGDRSLARGICDMRLRPGGIYSIKDIDRVGDTKLSNYRRIRIAPTEIYTYDDLRRRE